MLCVTATEHSSQVFWPWNDLQEVYSSSHIFLLYFLFFILEKTEALKISPLQGDRSSVKGHTMAAVN